ncbi:mitotic spindle checkpoint protein bubr1 [Phtheirospermum japonicum]|uniref:Mitotic spindle checkpoint protein bubr1 n=1 Tax=Phtheirospermum japonicum TaxID=374723 RepID=A0A830CP81_9LAMI|nr:mitotic spindle checkpoint protein bubr1 [Phtheirospermum japonicum]
MSDNGSTLYNNLFSSLISDIKSYNGLDPLLPWLRLIIFHSPTFTVGIRKMKETLPPQLSERETASISPEMLRDLLNRSPLLQRSALPSRLMDFVDDPKAILKTMEKNRIGMKKSLFYQAYALYYEKMKKFDAAEKIYHLGVQNLAEPTDELQKSYEQFLHRMGRHKNKRIQLQEAKTKHRSSNHDMPTKDENSSKIGLLNDRFSKTVKMSDSEDELNSKQDGKNKICGDDTVFVKFVDTAIVGKSNAEDARHHGLVEPTINTREAMNAINSMFREPIEPSIAARRNRSQTEILNDSKNGFTVFTNDKSSETEPFDIYVDGEETNDAKEKTHTVFAKPNDFPSEGIKDPNPRRAHQSGLREDTFVYRFVGSTISDELRVENVWHHGLVDPTINLKEAMEDINGMFGKPIEFVRKSRTKKNDKAPDAKSTCGEFMILPDDEADDKSADVMNNNSGFLILPDDELDNQCDDALPSSSTGKRSDLFEQTVCTKEAMDEINKLFAMPMDF